MGGADVEPRIGVLKKSEKMLMNIVTCLRINASKFPERLVSFLKTFPTLTDR